VALGLLIVSGFVTGVQLRPEAKPPPVMERIIYLPAPATPPPERLTVTATAFSSTRDQTDSTPCIGAAGENLCLLYNRYGIRSLAVSRDLRGVLPRRTFVRIDGRVYRVTDTMHPRWRNRIDLWFPSRGEAKWFGKRTVEVEILERGSR